jgi:hypothetical protein
MVPNAYAPCPYFKTIWSNTEKLHRLMHLKLSTPFDIYENMLQYLCFSSKS